MSRGWDTKANPAPSLTRLRIQEKDVDETTKYEELARRFGVGRARRTAGCVSPARQVAPPRAHKDDLKRALM